jgi:hypothetical protein
MARIYAKTPIPNPIVASVALFFDKIPDSGETCSPDLGMSLLPGISSDYQNPVFSCGQGGGNFVPYQKHES